MFVSSHANHKDCRLTVINLNAICIQQFESQFLTVLIVTYCQWQSSIGSVYCGGLMETLAETADMLEQAGVWHILSMAL